MRFQCEIEKNEESKKKVKKKTMQKAEQNYEERKKLDRINVSWGDGIKARKKKEREKEMRIPAAITKKMKR